jgi:large subunit ribosomal protein L18
MKELNQKTHSKASRKHRVATSIRAKSDRPRLSVFVSNRHFSAQIIDDSVSQTKAAASSASEAALTGLKKSEKATKVGELIAARAKKAGIESVVFDRGSKKYHGHIKALADAAREKGLKF